MISLFDEDIPIATADASPDSPQSNASTLQVVPRDYQQLGIDRAFELWENGEPGVIYRQATGTGKTVSGTLIAHRWLSISPDHYCIVLAHERQLVSQFADEIEDILGWRPGIEMADQHVYSTSMPRIVVASRQTLFERKGDSGETISRLFKFDSSKHWLLIADECHRWAWKLKSCQHIVEWFASNPASRRLGLTATPLRGDKTSLAKLFPGVACDYRYVDAVRDGWLVPYDQRFVTVEGVDFKNLREVAGDFDEDQLETMLGERETLLSLVGPTLDLVQHRRTIIFSPTVGMAKMVAQTINEFGRYKCGSCGADQWQHRDDVDEGKSTCKKCSHPIGPTCSIASEGAIARSLDGSYPDSERQVVYRSHQSGEFQFLSVCGLCREGYNDPGIQAVAIYRPTKSQSLAEQMKGRGCRPLRGVVKSTMTVEERIAAIAASFKPNCMIIDLVGVTGLGDVASTAQILAEGKPDEVIELANEMAIEAAEGDEPVDMLELIDKAEKRIQEEKEEEERKKREAEEKRKRELEERRRREQELADQRRKIRGDVSYTATKVRTGDVSQGAAKEKLEKVARMPFGRHRGEPIKTLEDGYLRGILNIKDLSPWLRNSINRELQLRSGKSNAHKTHPANSPATEGQNRLLRRWGMAEASTYAEAVAGIAKINEILRKRVKSN